MKLILKWKLEKVSFYTERPRIGQEYFSKIQEVRAELTSLSISRVDIDSAVNKPRTLLTNY